MLAGVKGKCMICEIWLREGFVMPMYLDATSSQMRNILRVRSLGVACWLSDFQSIEGKIMQKLTRTSDTLVGSTRKLAG